MPKCQWLGSTVDEHGKLKLGGEPQTCNEWAAFAVTTTFYGNEVEIEGPELLCKHHAKETLGGLPERVYAENASRNILIEPISEASA